MIPFVGWSLGVRHKQDTAMPFMQWELGEQTRKQVTTVQIKSSGSSVHWPWGHKGEAEFLHLGGGDVAVRLAWGADSWKTKWWAGQAAWGWHSTSGNRAPKPDNSVGCRDSGWQRAGLVVWGEYSPWEQRLWHLLFQTIFSKIICRIETVSPSRVENRLVGCPGKYCLSRRRMSGKLAHCLL